MSKEEHFNFEKSAKRIEEILQEVESGEMTIDELNRKVAEAADLLKKCRAFLRSTEEELTNTLSQLDED